MNHKPGELRRISVLSAPSNLGLKPPAPGREPGVRELPAALLRQGLLAQLHAADAGVVAPPPYDPNLDPQTGLRNAASIRRYSLELAERVGDLLDQSRFPLVLGGDCSILLGSALALKRRGRFGLLFIDGHTDLLTAATSQSGGVAGMDLAFVTGMGTDELTSIDGLKPYVQPEDVVVFGFRLPEPGEASPAQPKPPMLSFPLGMTRERGVSAVAKQAVAHFGENKFWIHVDADVLNPRWMPAVDSPDPGGMSPQELAAVLRIALSARNCAGMELTIYDPTLDHTGHGASLFVHLLRDAIAEDPRSMNASRLTTE